MMRFIEDRAKELQKIIDEMNTDTSIALLHDADPDGLCAGVLFDAYIKSQDKRISWKTNPLARERPFTTDFVRKIDEHKITHLFILDYNLESYGWKKEFESFRASHPDIKVCVVDHHAFAKDFDFYYHANTAFDQTQISPDQYCTTKYLYDVLMCIWPDVEKLKRIAAIGIIGDWNHKTWGLFIQETLKTENKERLQLDQDDYHIPTDFEEYFACPYGKIAMSIFYGIAKEPKQINFIFDTIKKNNALEDMLHALDKYKEVEEEIDDYIENFEYCAKNTPINESPLRVFELELKSQNDILVITANLISLKDPDTIFFLYEKRGDSYIVSVRSQKGKVNLGDVMKQAAANIENANGGGHTCAAGAKVPKGKFDDFKELFYKQLDRVKI